MEKISFIISKLNLPPFEKNIQTLSEFDAKSPLELFEIILEVSIKIDPDLESIHKEQVENKVTRLLDFLILMKFSSNDHYQDFYDLLLGGDKDLIYTILNWLLLNYESLIKRNYLKRFLMPLDVPGEFFSEDSIKELLENLKNYQNRFKEIHKNLEKNKAEFKNYNYDELKKDIKELINDKKKLEEKITKMKNVSLNQGDEQVFKELLNATSSLRKEQEQEVMIHDRIEENKRNLEEVDQKLYETSKKLDQLKEIKNTKKTSQEILKYLTNEISLLEKKKMNLEEIYEDKERKLSNLNSWTSNSSNNANNIENEIRSKKNRLDDLMSHIDFIKDDITKLIEKDNNKLLVFKQASLVGYKKLNDKEETLANLKKEHNQLLKVFKEKSEIYNNANANEENSSVITKDKLKNLAKTIKDKMDDYQKYRENLNNLKNELVQLKRTEDLLKIKNDNLEDFLNDLEKKQGIEGYRDVQRKLIDMTEKTAEIDQKKSETLEEISAMVEKINKEFKEKQNHLQPLIAKLKAIRQNYNEVETFHNEKKLNYEKILINYTIEKEELEKECDRLQEESLLEESKYHYIHNLIKNLEIKINFLECENNWRNKNGRLMRDFQSYQELYTHKLTQQEQLIKQLRKRSKELNENAGLYSNQKEYFSNLSKLLEKKKSLLEGEGSNFFFNMDSNPIDDKFDNNNYSTKGFSNYQDDYKDSYEESKAPNNYYDNKY